MIVLFNGIIAQSRTNLISAQITSETNASLFIFNQNALRLENTFVTNGNIGVTNTGGNLQAADVRTGGLANSRIFFRTLGVGSDISLGRVEAADRGEIFFDSADDIFDSSFADDLFVEAEFHRCPSDWAQRKQMPIHPQSFRLGLGGLFCLGSRR